MAGRPGGIIRRSRDPSTPRPEITLPFGMKGAEPLFRWLMDTAKETKEIQFDIHAQLVRIAEILEHIDEVMDSRSATGEPERVVNGQPPAGAKDPVTPLGPSAESPAASEKFPGAP